MSIKTLLTPTMLFCFLIILLSHVPSLVISVLPLSEHAILLKIKHQWAIEFWHSTTSPCKWTGIKCTGGITITEIYINGLTFHNIKEIPPYICDLKNLTILDLAGNSIPGYFPTSLYNCTKLQILDLSDNKFGGQLPKDIDRLSSNLQHLDLSFNKFTGDIPSSFAKLKGLITLHFHSNSFNGTFPSELGSLESLKELLLDNNPFFPAHLPKEFRTLKSLEILQMSQCQLIGEIPNDLAYLTSLRLLNLSNNNLTGQLPKDIDKLSSNLQHFDLSFNKFTGDIPSSFAKLKGLITLHFHSNLFNGTFPFELGSLESLEELSLDNNPFLPTHLPKEFGMFKSLKYLQMSGCQLIGYIPIALANLTSLQLLDLSNNKLTGKITKELTDIDSWKSLQTLNLANNRLSGPVTVALVSLPSLIHLDLSYNKLSGKLPYSFYENHNTYDCIHFNHNANLCSDEYPGIDDFPDIINNIGISLCFSSSSSLPHKFLALIIVLGGFGVAFFLMIIYITILMVNKRKKEGSEQQVAWKLKTFHRIDFTETKIVSGLIANNMIGSGGSGAVYMMIVNDAGDKVAVKRIWNGRNLEKTLEKQFLTEVEILGTFRHTNIVKLLCCISSAQEKLLVYEYMENQSLDKWLHRKRGASVNNLDPRTVLDWPTRLRIAVGAAKGLCYLHYYCSPPIIHRDLKSSNILLDSQFNAKIADFGLSIMTYKTGDPHTASVVVGSFGYIAPEYLSTKRMNEKIDVYSFGVVLLELATGKHPCKGNDYLNLADWSRQYCCEDHHIIEALDEDIKEERFMEHMVNVFKLGLMCTSKKPGSRPTMQLVVQLLIEWSHSENHDQALRIDKESEYVFNGL